MAKSDISPVQSSVGPVGHAARTAAARAAEHRAGHGSNKEGKPSYDPNAAAPAGSVSVGSPRPE